MSCTSTWVPVLLLQGIRLFEHLGHDPIELERTSLSATPAATHLTFRVGGRRGHHARL
jgi:hypothetical protein